MYRLHYAPDNASLIVRLALLELGQPFQTRLVDRARREQAGPAFLALNPAGVIPVLETAEGALSETAAILLWLIERHGRLGPAPATTAPGGAEPAPGADARAGAGAGAGQGVMGRGVMGRGAFLKWLAFVSNTVHAELRLVFHPEAYVGASADAQRALHAGATARLRRHLGLLDRLGRGGADWFCAHAPSALDLYVAVLLRWSALYARHGSDWFDPESLPCLMEMAARLETRAAIRAAAQAEGLGAHPFTAPEPCRPPEGSPT